MDDAILFIYLLCICIHTQKKAAYFEAKFLPGDRGLRFLLCFYLNPTVQITKNMREKA